MHECYKGVWLGETHRMSDQHFFLNCWRVPDVQGHFNKGDGSGVTPRESVESVGVDKNGVLLERVDR